MSTEEIVQRTRLLDSEIKVGSRLWCRQQSSQITILQMSLGEGFVHNKPMENTQPCPTASSSGSFSTLASCPDLRSLDI